jgi:hypothetical protein
MRHKTALCVVVASLLFTDPAVAQWRAYSGAKRPKKELVLLEKESGIRLLSVNGTAPVGPRRELPAEQPVWPRIWCLPGRTTIRLAIECKECRRRVYAGSDTFQEYTIATEPIEIDFEMKLGTRYLLDWHWSEHKGLIPTADVRVWVEADRPYLGVNPRGQTVVEKTLTVPLVREQSWVP